MTIHEAEEMIGQFENGTWPKEQWTHHAHFVMALWYCFYLPFPEAVQRIKEGIKKYNLSTGGQNTEDAGYHETITVFYIHAIGQYLLKAENKNNLGDLLAGLDTQPFIVKDFLLQFYSRELLFSREARREWRYPDKQSFCFQ